MDKKILEDHIDEINEIIYEFLPDADEYNAPLTEAVNYSIKAGGKRLRPMLMLETFRLFSDTREIPEMLKILMASIEFIHTHSLIHDDLPCIDNDDLRRGITSTHKKFGEALGVLSGDALLNYAYEIALRGIDESSDPEYYMCGISSLRVLSEKAGMYGMLSGQSVDVYSEKNADFTVGEKELGYIYKKKTAALFEAPMMIGAIFGGASDLEVKIMEKAACYIGLAFQIRDDILDVTGNTEELGKSTGSDDKNNKVTYVTYYGMEKAKSDVDKYMDAALNLIKQLKYKNSFLMEVLQLLSGRNK